MESMKSTLIQTPLLSSIMEKVKSRRKMLVELVPNQSLLSMEQMEPSKEKSLQPQEVLLSLSITPQVEQSLGILQAEPTPSS